MSDGDPVINVGMIEQRILLLRGKKIIIDVDLAECYGVPTKRLNEQVKRNKERFPEDFVFKLTESEKLEVVAKCDHLRKLKFSRALPFAFTEHGAIMAASVLSSERAIKMSVFVVRAFVQYRQYVQQHLEIRQRLEELERTIGSHDQQISVIVEAIKRLISESDPPPQRQIGFAVE